MSKQVIIRMLHFFLFVSFSFAGGSQGITLPRVPSPAAMVSQTIGISTITVNYSRPSVKSRKVWGGLVPYGWNKQGFGTGNEAPWRAGANENTTISISHDANVAGKPVPAGVYGLFFVVNKDNSGEVILSKDSRSWGSYFYDSKQDILRSGISIREGPHTEMLSYDFSNITKNSADLVLKWEKKQLLVKILFDVDKIVLANAAEELKGPTGFNWQGFSSAANYALQNKINLDQALTWINNAVAQNNGFPTLIIKSGILKELNKSEEAEKVMNEAIAVGTETELNAYGYQLMNDGEQEKAIQLLTINTKRFPKSANTWDSLGEAYFIMGDKKNAAIFFKKALGLNPSDNVKINSEKYLRQMGEL
ncbi:MAG: DUF2911 domain-containing protein [Ferruginibacter sp.]